jgi:DNA-binding response OmpR family regulator
MKALVVEDDRPFAATVVQALVSRGFEVVYCENPTKVEVELARHSFTIVVIDLMFPAFAATSGIDVLRKVRRRLPDAIAFLMTIKNSEMTEIVAEAMRGGAAYFFDKNAPRFLAACSSVTTSQALAT